MRGPYTVIVPGLSPDRHATKRDAIRTLRRTTKARGEGTQGSVTDGDGQLVRQVEAYRTDGGAIKVRELEL